jgi:hypothetical protein
MSEPRLPEIGELVLGWTGEYWDIVCYDGFLWGTSDGVAVVERWLPLPDPETAIPVPKGDRR